MFGNLNYLIEYLRLVVGNLDLLVDQRALSVEDWDTRSRAIVIFGLYLG